MPVRPNRPKTLPTNYPATPASFPTALFRLQVDAAKRYLFEPEILEVLDAAGLPHHLIAVSGPNIPLTVAQVATFMQELKAVVGEEKALGYGAESFARAAALVPKPSAISPMWRAVSSVDKVFLRIRESMAGLNRLSGANVLVKWHGGSECELFEDTGQHCYGYMADGPACQTLSGFLEAGIGTLSGVPVELVETDCMTTGALTCRWTCRLR